MRSRVIALFLLLCLLIGGCRAVSTDDVTTLATTAAATTQAIGSVSLGITPKQFLSVLSAAGIEVQMPDYAELPLPDDVPDAAKDGRVYNMADYSFYYTVKGYKLNFTFDYTGSLINIYCADSGLTSRKGLAVGDSVAKVEKLYGTDYARNPEGVSVMQYNVTGGYFNVFYADDVVTAWSLNAYPNINND